MFCIYFLQHVTTIIPDFYDDMDLIDDSSMPLPPFDLDDDDFLSKDDDLNELNVSNQCKTIKLEI